MKINRTSEEKMAPSWAFNSVDQIEGLGLITSKDVEAFDKLPSELTDENIVDQRDNIELCASNGSVYYCNSSWDKNAISSLHEYASICGLSNDKFKSINPKQVEATKSVQFEADKSMSKEIRKAELSVKASKNASEAVELLVEDPFKLDKMANAEEMQNKWTPEVAKQEILSEKPSMMSGAVRSIRGGEDYFGNSDINLVTQNSITNPDAIKSFAENGEDNGAKLRKEQKDKAAKKEVENKAWEQGKIDAMTPNGNEGVVAKGCVFPTEIVKGTAGIYKEIERPDKTMGEKITEANETRKEKTDKEKHDFVPGIASSFGISDTFANELSKYLK